MLTNLTKTDRELFAISGGKVIPVTAKNLPDFGLSGDCTGLRGYCSGLRGDLNDCGLTDLDRKKSIDISILAK